MRVGLIIEGAYPFVAGGVSSWVQQLMTSLPEIEFYIYSIMPSIKECEVVHYTYPENLKGIKVFYLDAFKKYSPNPKLKKVSLSEGEKQLVREFVRFETQDHWEELFHILKDEKRVGNPIEFIYSRFFWNELVSLYKEAFSTENFNDYIWMMRSMYIYFLTILQEEASECDVYHAISTGYAGILGATSKLKHHKPLILTEHGIYSREREEEILQASWVKEAYKKHWIKFFYFISRATYTESDTIVALFERNSKIQHNLGAEGQKLMVIHNGVNLSHFSGTKERERYTILSVLRVVPIKDVKTLLKAFRMVLTHIPQAKLLLVGPTHEDEIYYFECIQMCKDLKIDEHVQFLGKQKVKEYFQTASLAVLSSISEGEPLVLLEGMALEIPWVTTDVGACSEILIDKKVIENSAGIVVKPTDYTKMAEAIIYLLTNEDVAKRMGKNGRDRVEKYYREESFIESYKLLYQKLYEKVGE